MTLRKFLYRTATGAQREDVAALEVAAILDTPCPSGGNRFVHIALRLAILEGTADGRAVWERHRRQIMDEMKFTPGTRPMAWWQFEAPQDAPRERLLNFAHFSQAEQAVYLHSHGMLAVKERKKLPAEWFTPRPPSLEVIQ